MKLAKAPDVTPRLLVFLAFMSENIDNRQLPRMLVVDAITGRLERMSETPSEAAKNLFENISRLSEPTQYHMYKAIASFVYAQCNSDILFGLFLRRLVFFSTKRDVLPAAFVVSEKAALDTKIVTGPGGETAALAA
jgi:hypothetical protein